MSRIQPSSSETISLRNADMNSKHFYVGWGVLRFWEHKSTIEAVEIVVCTVAMARAKRCASTGIHEKN